MHENGRPTQKSLPTLSDPMDCSLPGSSVHEVFQARVLEWGAIVFSVPLMSPSKVSLHLCVVPFDLIQPQKTLRAVVGCLAKS